MPDGCLASVPTGGDVRPWIQWSVRLFPFGVMEYPDCLESLSDGRPCGMRTDATV